MNPQEQLTTNQRIDCKYTACGSAKAANIALIADGWTIDDGGHI